MFDEKLAIERWCGMSLSQSSPMGQWSATTSATNRLMMMVMMMITAVVVVVVCFDQRNPTILRGFQIVFECVFVVVSLISPFSSLDQRAHTSSTTSIATSGIKPGVCSAI